MKTITLTGTVTADGIVIDDPSQPAFTGVFVRNHEGHAIGAPVLVDFSLDRHWLPPHELVVTHITAREQ